MEKYSIFHRLLSTGNMHINAKRPRADIKSGSDAAKTLNELWLSLNCQLHRNLLTPTKLKEALLRQTLVRNVEVICLQDRTCRAPGRMRCERDFPRSFS